MSTEAFSAFKSIREVAEKNVSPDITDSQDRRDTAFLLSCVMLAEEHLGGRKNIKEYFDYAKENQVELLTLAKEFDEALIRFNETAAGGIDPSHINTIAVREEDKLGKSKVPLLLGEREIRPHEAVEQIDAGVEAFVAQNKYMKRSEDLGEEAKKGEEGWSEIHLNADSPEHFLATFVTDLYPGMLRRWLQNSGEQGGMHEDLDTDELVRAICENLDPKSELFRLIKDQQWFDDTDFSPDFRAQIARTE